MSIHTSMCKYFENFNETQLPSIDNFYSSLKLESINEKDYQHANEVFKHYKCKTIKDYLSI